LSGAGGAGLQALVNDYIQKDTLCPTAKARYHFGQTASLRYWIYCPGASILNPNVPRHNKNNRLGGPILDSQTGIDDSSTNAF